jgi:large subunit ribosomal protein L18
MLTKKQSRMRRGKKTRRRQVEQNVIRLCVHKTPRHIYAQLISPEGGQVLASASTLDKSFKALGINTGNVEAAKQIGQLIAASAKGKELGKVAFDRSGFKYHGRIKALADAAREGGIDF